MIKAEWTSNDALSAEQVTQTNAPNTLNAFDCISRQAAIDALEGEIEVIGKANAEAVLKYTKMVCDRIKALPSAQPEVIPHRNYKYLSDYWCECGWHLGKKGEVKYCSECGRKVNWDG